MHSTETVSWLEKDVGSHGILMGNGDFYEMFMGFSGDLYRIYWHFMGFSGGFYWNIIGTRINGISIV